MLESFFEWSSTFFSSLLTVLKIILRSGFGNKIKKGNTNSIIILGNGPSLNSSIEKHRAILKKKELFCVNKFPDTQFYEEFKPRHFAFVSREYFKPGKVQENILNRKNIIDAFIEKTKWPVQFYMPYEAQKHKNFIEQFSRNSMISIQYFNTTPLEGFTSWNNFFMRKNLGCPRPHNVLIPSIQIAINAGFKKIYLLGADHSWLPQISVNNQNEALINQKHFYDESTSESKPMHHQGLEPRKLHEILEKFVHSFKSYFDLKSFAHSRQAKIYNATPDSFIDAFERRKLSEIEN